ncbi:MAG: NnrU family protein [Gammaproteobacteria bacterium]
MLLLIIGLVLFLGIHSVSIVAEGWRDSTMQRVGEGAWKGIYSLVSLAGFGLIVWGYGEARLDPVLLYAPPAWLRHVGMLVLLPVFPLLVAVYFPGRIKRVAKHPMLLATKLWAFAHLLMNGMLADVLLFGGFLIWAIADRISMKRRTQRPLPSLPESKINDVIVFVVGIGIYFVFVKWLHTVLIGIPIMPG